MITKGQIKLSGDPYGYSVVDNPAGFQSGYTEIEGHPAPTSVPEPSALVLGCLAVAGVAAGMRWRRRGRRCR